MGKLSYLTFFCVVISVAALAQAGSLDNTFGTNGVAQHLMGGWVDNVALQQDGKFVTAGGTFTGGAGLIRFNSDGSVDGTFGTDGEVHLIGAGTSESRCRVSVQPDGKIVASSGFSDWVDAFYILRFNQDGSPDMSFGSAGKKKKYIPDATYVYSSAHVLDSDGKLVQVGHVTIDSVAYYTVLRYNSNGSLDNSFGVGGVVLIELTGYPHQVFQQLDGNIIVYGYSTTGPPLYNNRFTLIRLKPDGSLDNTFDSDGMAFTNFATSGHESLDAYDMVLQPDGKIVIAGSSSNFPIYSWMLGMARLNPDGSLDNGFGVDGKVLMEIDSSQCSIRGIAIQSDNKLVVTGQIVGSSGYYWTGRFLSTGLLDPSFGSGGFVITNLSQNFHFGEDLAIQPDGKILTVGRGDSGMVAIRYLSGLEVGIVEFSSPSTVLLLFPNPLTSMSTLTYELRSEEIITIDLLDIQGKLVQTFTVTETQEAGKHEQTLNFNEQLPPGNYILRIGNGISHQAVKIIKQ